ncbi:MAG TPA: ABC transporter permease [Thermomicrobiales bacterium]|nr:ABC transporter permease [Thermomicrobiales bacterium]
MTAYIIRRLLLMIPVAFLVSVIIFTLLRLTPGDPITVLMGDEPDRAVIATLRHQYGLDRPIPVQYLSWITRFLHGDMGRSIRTQEPVSEAILSRFPATLELGFAALCFSLAISIPIGILSATKRNSIWDLIGTSFPLLGISIPNFFTGILLILFLALAVHVFPPGGYVPFAEDPAQNIKRLVLPMITLGTPSLAVNMRFMRSGLIDALGQEYTRVARAKGLAERAVVIRHALKNAFIPFVTVVGLQVGALLEGAFITETIFLWPGVGRLAVDSISGRDYPVVQGIVLLSALSFMAMNLIVDVLYAFLDPRIKYR